MYRVTFDKLLEILTRADYQYAVAQLRERELTPNKIKAVEVDFTIDEQGTKFEVWTVSEFNIYTTDDKVLFGKMTRHGDDFTIEWARTKPHETFFFLPDKDTPLVDPKAKEALDFLHTRSLDACEYADTNDKTLAGYKEADQAYAIVVKYLKKITENMDKARIKTGDLSRVIEKMCGESDNNDEINRRIDEIYKLLKGE